MRLGAGTVGIHSEQRGVERFGAQKGNERALKQMDSSVYIIYRATHPALLLECGFMSNQKELNRFKDKKYRSNFAFAVFLGINDYLTGENDGEKQH